MLDKKEILQQYPSIKKDIQSKFSKNVSNAILDVLGNAASVACVNPDKVLIFNEIYHILISFDTKVLEEKIKELGEAEKLGTTETTKRLLFILRNKL